MLHAATVGLGNTTGVLVGQALGARRYATARVTGITSLALGMMMALALASMIALNAPSIAALYGADAEVRRVAAGLLVFVAGYHLFDAVQAVTVNVLRGYKRAVVPMLIYGVGLWCVGLAGGYTLGLSSYRSRRARPGHAHGRQGLLDRRHPGHGLVGVAVAGYFFFVSAPQRARRGGSALAAENRSGGGC